jgi:hypothetical protein
MPPGDHGLHRHVEPHHQDGPRGREDRGRGLRIVPDVGLSHRGDIAGHSRRAAHHRDPGHEAGQLGIELERRGDVRERPHRHQPDLAGMSPHEVDDLLLRGRRRLRAHRMVVAGTALPVVAVHVVGELGRPAQHRALGAAGDRHVGAADQIEHAQGVAGCERHLDIAPDRAHAEQLDVRVQRRVHNRHGIVDAGVAVEDHLRRHAQTLPRVLARSTNEFCPRCALKPTGSTHSGGRTRGQCRVSAAQAARTSFSRRA